MRLYRKGRRWIRSAVDRLLDGSAVDRWNRGRVLMRMVERTQDIPEALNVLRTQRFRKAVPPVFDRLPTASRVLVLAPHQDDAIIGAGGTLSRIVAGGSRVQCVYITDGSTALPDVPPVRVTEIREAEARAVWNRVGGEPPIFLRHPCNGILRTRDRVEEMVALFEKQEPQALFVPFLFEDPEDHRGTNDLLWLARAGLRSDVEVWAYQVTTMIAPNVAIDITANIEEKTEIMSLWVSQNEIFDYTHQVRGQNAANTLYWKTSGGSTPAPRYVELFFVAPLPEYLDLIARYRSPALEQASADV